MYNRVVIPLDGSSRAEQAIAQAIEFARIASIPIHLVRVIDPITSAVSDSHTSLSALPHAETASQEAANYLVRMRDLLSTTGVPITVEQCEGSAATEIMRIVRPGDLLAFTTHGWGDTGRDVLGQVADRLIRQSPEPILLCHSRPSIGE